MEPKEKMVMAQSLRRQSSPGKEEAKVTLRGKRRKERYGCRPQTSLKVKRIETLCEGIYTEVNRLILSQMKTL